MSGWDFAFWIVIAALIYSLVRPGAPTGEAVRLLGDLMVGLVGTATGYAWTKE